MVMSKTPYRISFFGGGSDYPNWFNLNSSMVLGIKINKFTKCAIQLNLPSNFKFHLTYLKTQEYFSNLNDLKHPLLKVIFTYFLAKNKIKLKKNTVYLNLWNDLPFGSGMGSSSSLTNTILSSLYKVFSLHITEKVLVQESIYIERILMGDSVGCQDQIMTCFSGPINLIKFLKTDTFQVFPSNSLNFIFLKNLSLLSKNLILCNTGIFRSSSKISSYYINSIRNNRANTDKKKLFKLYFKLIKKFLLFMNIPKINNFDYIGHLLNSAWLIKKSLNDKSITKNIANIYTESINSGALGGKILGAGSGGFMLLYFPSNKLQVANVDKINFSISYKGNASFKV